MDVVQIKGSRRQIELPRKVIGVRISHDFHQVVLCGYYDSDNASQHSSDVFFQGELISDRFMGVWAV